MTSRLFLPRALAALGFILTAPLTHVLPQAMAHVLPQAMAQVLPQAMAADGGTELAPPSKVMPPAAAAPKIVSKKSDLAAENSAVNLDPEKVSLEWTIYGAFNAREFGYFKNAQDLNPRRRREVDLERVVFEPELEFGRRFKLETEIEFEHGGTGSALEFDGFDESGEFERETGQGGEAKVDKLELTYLDTDYASYRVGLITVPVGVISQRHHPTEYFTTTRNRSEGKIIPSTWRSVGVGVFGDITSWLQYQAVLVQGLNSELFRKYNWIGDGAARKFETTNADNLAYALRLDYGPDFPYRKIGVSAYYGDTSRNRKKTDQLTVEAGVLVADIHAIWESDSWTFRALYLRGWLQNSEDVATANASLTGTMKPSGASAPLGKVAEAAFAEVGYNIRNLAPAYLQRRTDVFLRYDTVDPMKETQGSITRDARFAETSWTAGVNYLPRPEIVAKLQYSSIKSGLDSVPEQSEIMAGIGFYYSTEN